MAAMMSVPVTAMLRAPVTKRVTRDKGPVGGGNALPAARPATLRSRAVAARASAGSASEEPAIAFDPRVDTYTERRRAWESQLNARRKEWAADFKARADAKAAEVQSERARIEEAKAARKAAKALKSAARAEEVAREEKARARAKESANFSHRARGSGNHPAAFAA